MTRHGINQHAAAEVSKTPLRANGQKQCSIFKILHCHLGNLGLLKGQEMTRHGINQHAAAVQPEIHPSVFDALPDSALIREHQLVQSHKRPDSVAPLPFSAKTLLRMVEAETFPAPVRISPRVKVWKVGSVRAWLKQQEVQA